MSLFDTHREDTDEEDNAHPEQNETDDVAFVAKLRSSRTLASILKTIHFADVSNEQKAEHTLWRVLVLQDAIFCALPTGIKIIVEDKQCVQGNAFIDTRVFESYELTRQVRFRFHLETVLVRLSPFPIFVGRMSRFI